MVISKEHKYIFVAVDKTGTTSIEKFLIENDKTATKNEVEIEDKKFEFNGHSTAATIKKILGKYYNDYTVIGFVRNPYDRAVSNYFFYLKGAKPWKDTKKERPLIQKFKIKLTKIMPFKLWALVYPYRSIKVYFVDGNDNLIVDKIGFFENLQEDLESILISCGLRLDFSKFPHINKSHYKEDTTYFRDGLFKRFIALRLKSDLLFYESMKAVFKTNNG